jgi:opine dehydrogenase
MTAAGAERLGLIGSGVVADALAERAGAAGWGVDRVALFPSDADAGQALSDGGDALVDSSIVVVATLAGDHGAIGILLRDHVPASASVVLVPGLPGAALQIAKALGGEQDRVVAETSAAPLAPAAGDPAAVSLTVPLASLPAAAAPELAERLAPVLDAEPVESVLWTALHAPDLILRTVPSLLAAAGERPAATLAEALAAGEGLVDELEHERAAVAAALGLEVATTAEWLARQLGTAAAPLAAACGPLGSLEVPHYTARGWLPDAVGWGLVPFAAIAAAAGVPTPTATSLIVLANGLCGTDFELAGRSAEAIGLVDAWPELTK